MAYGLAAQAAGGARAAFIRRTYAHLAGAILALIGVEAALLNAVGRGAIDRGAVLKLLWGSGMNYLAVVLAFTASGWVARVWASSGTWPGLRYAGLALYVAAWAVMLLPLLLIAHALDPKVIRTAGILTLAVFGGLTLSVFVTRKDYSFLGPVLCLGTLVALGVLLAALAVGFSVGLIFCSVLVALMAGYILYDTSNVMLHYRTDQHVAAALELFADVALVALVWYVVQTLLSFSSRD
jgi:FtsH-binding integral membrane protein